MFDDSDMSNMFSKDSYDTILVLLNSDRGCQVDGLLALSDTLMYGNQESLGQFPVHEVARKLTELLTTAEQNDIKELSSQCMNRFLEAHPNSTRALIEAEALQAVSRTLTSFCTITAAENCVRIFSIVADFRPVDLGSTVGIGSLMSHLRDLKVIEQRAAAQAILKITNAFVNDSFIENIEALLGLCRLSDEAARSNIVLSLANILKKVDKDKMDVSVLDGVIALINELEDGNCMLAMMRAVMNMSAVLKFGIALLPNRINFERVFFGPDFKGNTNEIRRSALNVILNLLPDVDLPDGFWVLNKRTLEMSPDFAREIKPFALRLLFEKAGRETLVLAVIAACLIVEPFEPSPELLSAMAGLVQTPVYAPFVLLVAKTLPKVRVLVSAGIMPLFRQVEVEDDIKEWYLDRLKQLEDIIGPDAKIDPYWNLNHERFEDLCDFVLNNSLTPFQFQSSGILKRASEFLQKMTEISPVLLPAIEKLVQLAHGVLAFMPVPKQYDPYANFTPGELLSKSIQATLKATDDEITGISIGVDLDFSGLEAWYNTRKSRVNNQMMMDALNASEFKDILIIHNQDSLFHTQQGLIRRNLNIESNVKYHFKINGKEFSAYDCMFHAIARSIDQPKSCTNVTTIEYIEGECPRAPIVVPLDLNEGIIDTLRLLERIHILLPTFSVQREQFTTQVFHQLASPVLTMGFFSAASRIIYHFPFMFDLEMRHAFFRIIGFDLSYSLPYMNNYFFKAPWNQRANSMKITCKIHRDKVFEDGIKLLKIAGPGMLRIDVIYDGEEGIGAGPTQEFFSLFSQELCKKSRGLWRNDCTVAEREHVFCEQGLFPAPNADPEMFYLIGLLVGKALLMDMIVQLPFNVAFCKLMMGEKITLADVDRRLADSLSKAKPDDLIGLPFTYPGYPEVQLKPGGESIDVTAENIDEYKMLIEKKTVEIPEIVERFRAALSTIVQWETLHVFSPEEICQLITGQGVGITEQDLHTYVEVSHGYTAESPQVSMLFETILEMREEEKGRLIKFITGSSRLPIGGLKSLKPKLTIAVRTPLDGQHADECLPSVMTCANYFKVPQYSSKAVMREKILIAISEGQDCFLLS